MHIEAIDRRAGMDISLPNGRVIHWASIVRLLDELDVPDGTPFLVADDGTFERTRHANLYLLEASRQQAYRGSGLRQNHAMRLQRFLRFLEQRNGPMDLIAATRADLVAYRDERAPQLAPSSWNEELSALTQFFYYAREAGWILASPMPQWGTRKRNTLRSRVTEHRRERFLTEAQSRFFLEVGLRGDAPSPLELRPRHSERDYAFGLTLLSTGLRREEAMLLLDAEVPRASEMPDIGVLTFLREGKGGVVRPVWVTNTLVDVLDLYRQVDRARTVQRAQATLRTKLRAGKLLVVDDILSTHSGSTRIRLGKRIIPAERFTNAERRRAVLIQPDGIIQPLVLFVADGGLAAGNQAANLVFSGASERINRLDHADKPPAHLGRV